MAKRKTTAEFIADARKVHGDKYDYSKVVYKNCDTPVIITCPIHGDFPQNPYVHVNNKADCMACFRARQNDNKRISTKEFIKRANKVHKFKYDYSLVGEFKNVDTKVNIICYDHGVFSQTPYEHSKGKGCKKCGMIRNSERFRLSRNQFIADCVAVHGFKYDYSKVVFTNTDTKINIICKDHGMFTQLAWNHKTGVGCPSCAKYGFQSDKGGYLYFLTDLSKSFIKIGIANDVDKRFSEFDKPSHKKKRGFDFELITYLYHTDGALIAELERVAHKELFAHLNAGFSGFDGATEWFKADQSIIDWMNRIVKEYTIKKAVNG